MKRWNAGDSLFWFIFFGFVVAGFVALVSVGIFGSSLAPRKMLVVFPDRVTSPHGGNSTLPAAAVPRKTMTPQQTSDLPQSDCLELIPRHNHVDEKRIHLIFIGLDYPSSDTFTQTAKLALDLEAQQRGLFSVEPFKSNQDQFNFWYVGKLGASQGTALDKQFGTLGEDAKNLASICLKKLGVYNQSCTPERPSLSDNVFTIFLANGEGGPSWFYLHNRIGEQDVCFLKGAMLHFAENESQNRLMVGSFVHEFAHVFTFQNPVIELRPAGYFQLADEYAPIKGPYVAERDYANSIKDHSNCFVGTYEQCNSTHNTLFRKSMGNGCGQEGIIDCCTNNVADIQQGARSCKSCPTCHEDPNYILEVGCYEGCWAETGIFRSTFNSIMRSHYREPLVFGEVNERILCHRIQTLTSRAEGICKK